MAKRFDILFTTLEAQNWRVEIHDQNFAGSSTEINGKYEGFNQSWNGASSLLSPILGSQCKFSMLIENTFQENFLNELIAADEERFRLVIFKGPAVDWMGFIVTDQVTIEDEYYPYSFNLTAIDGIARLKDKDFKDDSTGESYSGRESVLDHLLKVVNKIGLENTPVGYPTIRLRTNFNYYEEQMSPGTPAISQADINHDIFASTINNEVEVFKDSYYVLEELCKAFNCRFWFSKGKYHFFQFNEYVNNTQKIYNYNLGGSLISTDNAENLDKQIDYTNIFKERGTLYRFSRPTQKVLVNYDHTTNNNRALGMVWNQTNTQFKTLIQSLEVENENEVQIKCVIRFKLKSDITVSPSFPFPYHRQRFEIVLRIGDKFLNSSPLVWSDTVGGFQIDGPIVDPAQNNQEVLFEYTFTSPFIPVSFAGEEVKINVFRADIVDNQGTSLPISPPLDIENFDWQSDDNIVEILIDGEELEPTDTVRQYKAENSNSGNTQIITRTTVIGDGPSTISLSKITINGNDSENWGIGTTEGNTKNLNELNAEVLLSLTQKPLRKHLGTLFSTDLDPLNRLTDQSGYKYLCLSFSRSAFEDRISGEWIEVSYNSSDVVVTGPVIIATTDPSKPGGTGGTGNPTGGSQTPVTQNYTSFSINDITEIISTTQTSQIIVANSTPNLIAIDPVSTPFVKAGDTINLINSVTGYYETFTIATNYSPGDTTIETEEDLAADFPAGSFIQMSISSFINSLQTFSQKQENFSGEYWNITAGILPDPGTITESEIDLKVKVWRSGIRSVYNFETGFEIDTTGGNNRIKFKPKCRGENVLIEITN